LESTRALHVGLRVLGTAALLGIIVVSLLGPRHPLEEGAVAPAVDGMRRLDGSLARLALAQGRPLVINIWATWCAPCVQEMPMLEAAAKAYGAAVSFHGLAVDSERARVLELVQRLGITYDIAEIDGAVSRAYNASALPSTYILDGDGRIRWSVRGAIDRDMLDEHLRPLLQGPAASE
jgi:thiol-disulfide isomerase/thioredoxin